MIPTQKSFLFLLLLVVCNSFLQAGSKDELAYYREKYPDEEIVHTSFKQVIDIAVVDDKLQIRYDEFDESIYLGDNANLFNKSSFNYSRFYELLNYQAYSLIPDGKKYRKLEVTDFRKNTFSSSGVFHDDNVELTFFFPQLQKGAKSVATSSYNITDHHVLPSAILNPYLGYEQYEFTLIYDDGIDVALYKKNWDEINPTYKEEKKGNRRQLTWTVNIKPQQDFKSDAPGVRYFASQLVPYIVSYNSSKGKKKVLSGLDDLHRWYQGFISGTAVESQQLKNFADSLVTGIPDDLGKAARLFRWVQDNIQYIAIEDGYNGLIPFTAEQVFHDRFGDCKGMSNLLYSLLKSQGLNACLSWVGTRDLPYKYSELPTALVDNHMIVSLKSGDEWIFLDGTHKNLPFGMPSPFIQGKEVLINLESEKSYTIQTVPVIQASKNRVVDSCDVLLENTTLKGVGVLKLTGFARMDFVDHLYENNYKFLLQRCREMLWKGSNKFMLDTVWMENRDFFQKELLVHYVFHIPDYAINFKDDTYLNLNLEKSSMEEKIPADRKLPVEFEYAKEFLSVVRLTLKNNQVLNYLPENMDVNRGSLSVFNHYQQDKNIMTRRYGFIIDTILLEQDNFENWNALIDAVAKSFIQNSIIKNEKP